MGAVVVVAESSSFSEVGKLGCYVGAPDFDVVAANSSIENSLQSKLQAD